MPTPLPTERIWNAIVKLALDGQDTEKQIDDLESIRADLKGRLADMGMGHEAKATKAWKQTVQSFGETELTLATLRASLKAMARQSNKLVAGAIQGKLVEDEEVESILADGARVSLPLYEDAMKSAQAVGAVLKVGESDEDAAAKRTKPESAGSSSVVVDADEPPSEIARKTWRMLSVSVIKGLTPDCVKALQDVGLMNLNDVDRFLHEEKRSLATIDGFRRADSSKVYNEVDRWRKLDTEADAKAAAPKPAENGKPKGRKPKAPAAS